MEGLIRNLTHENEKFDAQWYDFEDRLLRECDRSQPTSTLDALAAYVLQEPQTPPPSECKFELLSTVIDALDYEQAQAIDSALFDHVSRVFVQVFEQGRVDLWHLAFLKQVYQHFQLGKHLPQRTPLVEQLLSALPKHALLRTSIDSSISKPWEEFWCHDILDQHLLNEKILQTTRQLLQQLFRFAVRHSSSSSFWSGIKAHVIRNLSHLFDSYVNPADAQVDLELCCTPHESDYRKLILKSLSNQPSLFRANYLPVLLAIERLLTANCIPEAQYFLEDVALQHSSSIPDLEPLLRLFIRISPQSSQDQREEYTTRILDNLCYKLHDVKANKKLWPLFFDLAVVALELHTLRAPKCAHQLLAKENFYPWKELTARVGHIIGLCGSYDDIVVKDDSYFSHLDGLQDILRMIHERAKVYTSFFHETHSSALINILRWASSPLQWSIHVYKMARPMMDLIDRKQVTLEIVSQLLQKLHDRLQIDDDPDDTQGTEHDFNIHLAEHLGIYVETLKTLSAPIHSLLNSLFLTTLDQPLQNENGSLSFGQEVFRRLWTKFVETLTTEGDARMYERSAAQLYYVASNEGGEETDMFRYWSEFWTTVGLRLPQIAASQAETFLNEFVDRNQIGFVYLLLNLYPLRPEPFHVRIDDIVRTCFQNHTDNHFRGLYLVLLQVVTKHHPEVISSSHMEQIFESFSASQPTLSDADLHGVFQFLAPVASGHPDLIDQYQQVLIRLARETQNYSVVNCLQHYYVSSATVHGVEVAGNHLNALIDLLRSIENCTPTNRDLILHACELIGIRHRQVLEAKRAEFVQLQCSKLVHLIDSNRMTEENKQASEQSRQEIGMIGERLQKTETDAHQVQSTVKRHELQVTNICAHVGTLDARLQDVTARVDIHQTEIERIDAKTLSYAPVWAAGVCKLLNRRAPNDWRLLGRRFGYSSSELKHWATQFDPCMALLNEWYMTHKADEATFGLVRMLNEIGRQDAEDIVRQTVNEAGETVPEAVADVDIRRLPPVFISYQWNAQPAVARLKGRLEEAGYACWMDVGQMGGGQELHAHIDRGIRGAKMMLCCMNKDYAVSDTCVGHVNLAISTGKPIIPLQMEKQTWPPEGALGPLMSDYLFIRFFDRKASNDPNFWPDEKFTELLGQLRYHAAPNPDMISERYKNWYVPRAEHLIFLRDASSTDRQTTTTHDAAKTSLGTTPLVISHPQVMISYQWDRQPDIIDLYKRLTELGYRVWLDIFQMGGGDSLFAKIDAGIRHAQCILACVTPKYSVSANCRREMSLADALGKPIVPLLLEPLNENWPPIGPMSLVFTGKLCIDLRSHQKNDMWQGKEYAQILVKLKQCVPEVQTENPKRHVVDMERPVSALRSDRKSRARRGSAPVVPQSRACSVM